MTTPLQDATRESIIDQLETGLSLVTICRDKDMPNCRTVQRWQNEDPEFDAAITHAREIGYQTRADQAILDAKTAEDAGKGRLAFDAERWYLGKLSNAFSDKRRVEHSGNVTLGAALDALEDDDAA